MPLVGLGAVLALASPSRAQSEVAPDHFDGTDSWAASAAAKAPAPKATQPSLAPSPQQAGNKRPNAQTAPQVISAKGLPEFQRPEARATPDRRKTPSRNSNN
jgi:hypothetical protein